MHRDVWTDDPVTEDDKKVHYTCETGKDYFAEVDRLQPPWFPENCTPLAGSGAALSDHTTPREVALPALDESRKKRIRTVPYVKYVRAIAPDGSLTCFSVSTCRQTPERPSGDDGLGTYMRVVAEKSKLGWLVLERDSSTWNPYAGKQGHDYIAWALAVGKDRQERHAAQEAKDAAAFMSKAQKQAEISAAEQLKATKEMAKEVGKEVADAVLKSRGQNQPRP